MDQTSNTLPKKATDFDKTILLYLPEISSHADMVKQTAQLTTNLTDVTPTMSTL